MKTVKRALALVLALTLLLAMSATVFAADDTGSITINNAVVGQSYMKFSIWKATMPQKVRKPIPTKQLTHGKILSTATTSRICM